MKKHMTQEVAIKSAWMILEGLGFSREINGDLEKTVTAVYESAPAADVVEVRHGEWIPIEYDGYADGYPVWDLWECSVCQEEHRGDEDTLTPYCPNCGAKMDGKGEGE